MKKTKESPRVLMLSDYDDTLYKTDDFVDVVLSVLKRHGYEQLADTIELDIKRHRTTTGTSAGYDLAAKLQDVRDLLEEELSITNRDRVFPDALEFYGEVSAMSGVDFRIWTRGQLVVQLLKLAGTPFAEQAKKVDIFSEDDKIARFLDKATVKDGGFWFLDKHYNKLIIFDNDMRYFEKFYRLAKAGVEAQGYLVHHNNGRFMYQAVEEGIIKVDSFDKIDPFDIVRGGVALQRQQNTGNK